ncbi:MAG: VWA domain-containing protein, partial [Bryobacteraceae bacterium]
GTAQKIVGFEAPPTADAPRNAVPAQPAVSVPGATRSASQVRLVTLVMDMADMKPAGLVASSKAASDYIQKSILTDDFVALYAIGSSMRMIAPYTRDKKRLLDGIKSLSASGNQGIFTARDRERTMSEIAKLQSDQTNLQNSGDIASRALADMAAVERFSLMAEMSLQNSFQTRALFVALRAIALAAGTLPGRKNVILFSEGALHADDAEVAMNAVISAANHGNVSIYVVDPSGTSNDRNNLGGGSLAENQSNTAPSGAGAGGRTPNTAASRQAEFARMGPQVVGGQTKFDMARQSMALDSQGSDLADIAAATGGFVVRNNSALTSLERIDRDLRDHYSLTYQPTETNFDGKFRGIKVEVAGKGHKIRYRKGYWALAPGDEIRLTPAAAQMVASVVNGSLKRSVTSKLNTALVFDSRTEHAVPFSVWLPGEDSWTTKDAVGGHNSGITVVVTARNGQGQLLDAYQKFIDFQATKEQWKDYEKKGVQLMASLSVPNLEPLDVEAIVQFSNGKTSLTKMKVPIAGTPQAGARATSLVLSSFIETAKEGSEPIIPALRISAYDLILPKEPAFSAASKLTVYFGLAGVKIEASSGRPLLGIAMAIKDGAKVVRELPALDGLYPWPKSADRLFFLRQFDLAGLAPGSYTVETTVRDRAVNTTTVQTAPFTVR